MIERVAIMERSNDEPLDAVEKRIRARDIPFDQDDPLLFHVLTALQPGQTDDLLRMIKKGVELAPQSESRRAKTLIAPRDVVAGDDEYVFTTPCNVFSNCHERARSNPAVAFHLSALPDGLEVAFRPIDMYTSYTRAEEIISYDVDEDEFTEEELAQEAEDLILDIAQCGTQYDNGDAYRLVDLYAEFCGSFRDGPYMIPWSNKDRRRIAREAVSMMPTCIADGEMIDSLAANIIYDKHGIADAWSDRFGLADSSVASFPQELLINQKPEFMVAGHLPLSLANWYRDEDGGWYPL